MRLYYMPGACSLSPHIVLREAGLAFELDRLDRASGKTESGEDFKVLNPKGYVPALRLDDGTLLTEGAVIVQYLADLAPEAKLAPPAGSLERLRLQELLNFIAAELHKSFSPLFASPDEAQRQAATQKIARALDYLESLLADGRSYLLGETFGVADAYLFVVANWSNFVTLDLSPWPNLVRFQQRIVERPTVKAALAAEGLLQAA